MFDKDNLKNHMLAFSDEGYHLVLLHNTVQRKDGTLACGCQQAQSFEKGYRDANGELVEDCPRVGKHPVNPGYTKEPTKFSDERIEFMCDEGGCTGYGVLLHWETYQLIAIDVDNHGEGRPGDADLSRLCSEADGLQAALMSCGLIVTTSNGGKHYYFKAPKGSYKSHLDGFEHIDIKVTGFVAGPGSLHRTGTVYASADNATAEDITDAPASLIELLRAEERVVSEYQGRNVEFDGPQIGDMLAHLKPEGVSKYDSVTYESYEAWLHVGMSIHAATGGSTDGLDMFDAWSQQMAGYNFDEIVYKWNSFGRSESLKGIGYLYDEARHQGWMPPARDSYVAEATDAFTAIPSERPDGIPDHVEWPEAFIVEELNKREKCDLTTPPGGVGVINEYIMRDGYKPRPTLSVAAAIFCIASASAFSMKRLDGTTVPTNMIAACAAGSGTGKNAVINNVAHMLGVVGMSGAMNGNFKSGQAIVRALIDNQAALFNLDEFGEKVSQVRKAHDGESHSYLAGVFAELMSMYSQSKDNAVLERELARTAAKETRSRIKEIDKSISGDNRVNENVAAEEDVAILARELEDGTCTDRDIVSEWHRALIEENLAPEEEQAKAEMHRQSWLVAEKHVCMRMTSERDSLKRVYSMLKDNRLVRPYLSMFGVTTGETFFPCMTPALIKNGLWSRAMLFVEHDDAPWQFERMAERELKVLRHSAERVMLAVSGGCANHFKNVGRVEEMETRETLLEYTDNAKAGIDAIRTWESVKAKSRYAQLTGATALYNRAAELTERLAVILAAGDIIANQPGKCEDGSKYARIATVTMEHVRWAYAMIERDTQRKHNLLIASMDGDPDMLATAVDARVKVHTPRGRGNAAWRGAVVEKIASGHVTRKDADKCISKMIEIGRIAEFVADVNPFDAGLGASAKDNTKIYFK